MKKLSYASNANFNLVFNIFVIFDKKYIIYAINDTFHRHKTV